MSQPSFKDDDMDFERDQHSLSSQPSPSYLTIPKIRVIVRKRPLSKRETVKNESDVVDIRNSRQVVVKELKTKVDLTKFIEEHSFQFDLAFDQDSSNEQIYLDTIRPMIEAAFNKTKVTCFAYGQTGSGKTFTMMGASPSSGAGMGIPGMYLLAACDIFTLWNSEQYRGFSIWVSFYEIYCGKLFDLLNERAWLTAREDGKQNICIVGLTEKNADNLQIWMHWIDWGIRARTVGVTGANSDSSRSHGIIQITIKDQNLIQHGKISFIDLAGSERAADTIDTNKQTRLDGAEINKSWLALKECIRALDQDKKHTPFRGSKLTLVLRDSFVGNCKTWMIANISPSWACSEHTWNTLRYADRVKELRGKGDINWGSGNANWNYDPKANNNTNKDPQEVLANWLMMPRQHKNTVKYSVDSAMNRININNKTKKANRGSVSIEQSGWSNQLNNSSFMGSSVFNQGNNKENVNQFTAPLMTNNTFINNNSKNVDVLSFNTGKYPKLNDNSNHHHHNHNSNPGWNCSFSNTFRADPKSNEGDSSRMETVFDVWNQSYHQQHTQQNTGNLSAYSNTIRLGHGSGGNSLQQKLQSYNNNSNSNFISTNQLLSRSTSQENTLSFLNEYTSFNDKQRQQLNETPERRSRNDEELNALKDKYETLVNHILTEEQSYLESHKMHIDDLVSTMKKEMNWINTVEKQANVDEYVRNWLSIFSSQEEKISNMKSRLIHFQSMLKEESELSEKIAMFNNDRN